MFIYFIVFDLINLGIVIRGEVLAKERIVNYEKMNNSCMKWSPTTKINPSKLRPHHTSKRVWERSPNANDFPCKWKTQSVFQEPKNPPMSSQSQQCPLSGLQSSHVPILSPLFSAVYICTKAPLGATCQGGPPPFGGPHHTNSVHSSSLYCHS